MKRGFTLVELIVVILIIGVLSTLGLVQYGPAREGALDREAIVNLKLIQAAMKIYGMEVGGYFDSSDVGVLNQDLKLALPTRNWAYTTEDTGDVSATRQNSPADWSRTWKLNVGDEDPTCIDGRCPP